MYTALLEHVRQRPEQDTPYGFERVRPQVIIQIVGGRIVDITLTSKETRTYLIAKLGASRTSHPIAQLATDTLEYTLGVARDGKSQARHAAYLQRLDEAVEATGHPNLISLRDAIRNQAKTIVDGQGPKLPDKISPQALTVLLIDGQHVHDDPLIQQYWQSLILTNGTPGEDGVQSQPGLFTDRLPATASARIRGKSGKREKAMLASANQPAFHNYGLINSFGTGLTAQSADAIGKAISTLLDDERHTVSLEGADLIYWTTSRDFNLHWLLDPQPEDIQRLFASPLTGQTVPDLDAGDFHGLLLASNTARLVVLDHLHHRLADTQDAARTFVRRLQVPRRHQHEPRPYGIRSLLRDLQTDGPKAASFPPDLDQVLLRHALTGQPLPTSLNTLIARRARTPQHVTPALAALAQLTLWSAGTLQEDHGMHDPPTRADLAYRTGQLLALASSIQQQAIGTVNTSLADTYFGLAGRNPAQAVGLILTNATVHLKKIRRVTPGLAAHFDQQLKNITAPFHPGALPTSLTPEEQTAFTLGYYHQLHTSGGRS